MIRDIYKKICRRKPDSHKGDYGHVLVVAGSACYTGAPYLASQAAARAGSGLVTLAVPKGLWDVMASKLVEVMVKPLPETKEMSLALKAEDEIVDFSKKVDVVALGPGLSLNAETQKLVRRLVVRIDRPLVVDADGLAALVGHLDILKKAKRPVVLTPHPGEMARLAGIGAEEIRRGRKNIALKFSKRYNAILVLKGYRTCVAGPDGKLYVNNTGNPGMASGGTGDVLTGIIAGFIGQGLDAYEASCLGVYVHGRAGDLAAKEKGQAGLIATDIIDKLPCALKALA